MASFRYIIFCWIYRSRWWVVSVGVIDSLSIIQKKLLNGQKWYSVRTSYFIRFAGFSLQCWSFYHLLQRTSFPSVDSDCRTVTTSGLLQIYTGPSSKIKCEVDDVSAANCPHIAVFLLNNYVEQSDYSNKAAPMERGLARIASFVSAASRSALRPSPRDIL